jgi:serine/threonine protein kinase
LHNGHTGYAYTRLATGLLSSNQLLRQRYMITRKLAQGGQSAVYLVIDTLGGGGQFALKEMSEASLSSPERDKAVSDFMREARMLSTLDHPALARVYDTFVEGQKHFLVMEYVQGHNLEDELIEQGRPLDWGRVASWGMALCDVLSYLHSQNPPIIYRDLKPANVMLTPEGALKLIDFGIARWLNPTQSHDTSQLGTDGYAPLEQYNARSESRSDLYALGASLYHLLTGRVPESAPARVAGSSLTPLRTVNPQVPEPVEHVIHVALSLQARDRFADAGQMRETLNWAIQRAGSSSGQLTWEAETILAPAHSVNSAARPATGGALPRATGVPLAPKLHLWPLRMDAGMLEPDEATVLLLEIGNRGGGLLSGRTETNLHCLTVAPNTIDPSISSLQVRIDTTGLRSGPYTCHLAVRTNGGDQIVPVRFHVRPPHGGRNTYGPASR